MDVKFVSKFTAIVGQATILPKVRTVAILAVRETFHVENARLEAHSKSRKPMMGSTASFM